MSNPISSPEYAGSKAPAGPVQYRQLGSIWADFAMARIEDDGEILRVVPRRITRGYLMKLVGPSMAVAAFFLPWMRFSGM